MKRKIQKRSSRSKKKHYSAPRKLAVESALPYSESDSPKQPPQLFQNTPEERLKFWDTFIRAVDAEPVQVKTVRGATGLDHPVIAMGIDRDKSRVIIVSGDPDGRSARLAQADIQTLLKDYKVISTRPIALNLAKAAESLTTAFGKTQLGKREFDHLAHINERTKKVFERRLKQALNLGIIPSVQALGYAVLNTPATIQDVITQGSHIEFLFASAADGIEKASDKKVEGSGFLNFGPLVALDPAELDRRMGVCSFPLYELDASEAAVFHSGTDLEAAKHILKSHDILQYFFPAPDVLALGLIDEKKPISPETLVNLVNQSPAIGHPLGTFELVSGNYSIDDLVGTLKDRGYSVEGEFGLELTESGRQKRLSVRFKPREGLLSLLLQRFSVNIDLDLKDIFGIAGPKP